MRRDVPDSRSSQLRPRFARPDFWAIMPQNRSFRLPVLVCQSLGMKPPVTRPSLFFRLVIPATVVFILTILSLIAALFGDAKAPVSVWLDAHGNQILLWEFVVVVVLSGLAMTIDRWRTLNGIEEDVHPGLAGDDSQRDV